MNSHEKCAVFFSFSSFGLVEGLVLPSVMIIDAF
jgi:hypothetical protein